MTCDSDCYLPGGLRQTDAGWRLDHEHGTVPITDPDGHLNDGDEGEVRTVGLAVTWDRAESASGPPDLAPEGDGAVLVGEPAYQRVRLTDRTPGPFHRIAFDPGLWPGESARIFGHGPIKAEPLRIHEGRGSDPVRIYADELRLVEVFRDGRDPYAGPLEGFRVEFDPDGSAVRLAVPGVPLWTTDGWHDRDPEDVLGMLGRQLRGQLTDKGAPKAGKEGFYPELAVEDDAVRLSWRWIEHRLGLWPTDGLAIDRETFVRGWLRDARLYDAWFDEALTDLRAEIREVTGLEPATDRRPACEPEAFERAALERIAREEPERRRDAIRALWLRAERESVSELSELREDDATRPADRRVLTGALDALGTQEALADLVETVQDSSSGEQDAIAALRDHASENGRLLAAALVDGVPADDLVAPLEARLRADDCPAVRELAGRTLVTIEGSDSFETLLGALVDEPDASVRAGLREALRRADDDAAEQAQVDHLADIDDPEKRRSLLECTGHEEVSDRETVVEALRGDDPAAWSIALRSAREFTADPPYDALLDRLVGFEYNFHADHVPAFQAGVESLRILMEADEGGMPPVEGLLDLLGEQYDARDVAIDALIELSEDYDGGDFHGVDPGRIHRRAFQTQSGNYRGDMEQLADLVAATLDEFDPNDLSLLGMEKARRAVLGHLVDRVGADAVPVLTELADGDDDALARKAQYLLREYPGSIPIDLDVDLASNARALLLYKRVVKQAIEDGEDERAATAVERIVDETLAADWPARATGAGVLGLLTDVEGVCEHLIELAEIENNTVVRAVAAFCLQFCEPAAVEETLVDLATDTGAATITRRFALRSLTNGEGNGSSEALDQLAPVTDYPPRVQPTAHQLLVEADRREADDEPPGEGLIDLGSPESDDPDDVVAGLDEIVENGDPDERAVALERLQEAYALMDDVEVTDVIDPMREALADDENKRVRAVAAIMLVLCHHRRSFEALREAGDASVGMS